MSLASVAKKQRLTTTRKCVEYAFLAEASQFNGGQITFKVIVTAKQLFNNLIR